MATLEAKDVNRFGYARFFQVHSSLATSLATRPGRTPLCPGAYGTGVPNDSVLGPAWFPLPGREIIAHPQTSDSKLVQVARTTPENSLPLGIVGAAWLIWPSEE